MRTLQDAISKYDRRCTSPVGTKARQVEAGGFGIADLMGFGDGEDRVFV